MRYSEIKRGMNRREAAEYVGGEEMLKVMEREFRLLPFIRRNNRLTRFDVRDLDRCIDLLKTPGQCLNHLEAA